MILVAQLYTLVLAIMMLVGGIIGFVKAKSKASIIAGTISAVCLAATCAFGLSSPKEGAGAAMLVSVALIAMFFVRWRKTEKFMPSGLLMILSIVGAAVNSAAFFIG